MLIRDKQSDESFVHVCEGKTEQDMRKKALEIRNHDVSFFAVKDGLFEHVRYCPYCGAELEAELEAGHGKEV